MTFIEKLKAEHPEKVAYYPDGSIGYSAPIMGCPHKYGYEANPFCATPGWNYDEKLCERCWNREMPESTFKDAFDEINKNVIHELQEGEKKMSETRKTKKELLEEIAELKKEVARVDQRKQFEDSASCLRMQYECLVEAGFCGADALELLNTMIQAAGGIKR